METQNIEYKELWRDDYLKWICGFANAQGGRLYIGVNDDGLVIGLNDCDKLLEDIPNKVASSLGLVVDVNLKVQDGLQYLEIIVPPSNIPISYHGIYHYRSGATKQELNGISLQWFLEHKLNYSWDDIPNENADMEDIDKDAIDYFLNNSIRAGRISDNAMSKDVKCILDNLNLLDKSGHLKNAALLLFGKNPLRFFPMSDFRIGRFGLTDSDLIIQDIVEGDIIRMADRVIDILRSKYLVSPIKYQGLQRLELLEMPEGALREAIFNAIIHKDYTGAHIQMKVYDDRIEIWNQGKLPDNWTIDNLLASHPSQPRNRNIAQVFYKAGFIESWGRGIAKIRQEIIDSGLKEPIFEEDEAGLRVTIFRRMSFISSEGTEFKMNRNDFLGTFSELSRNQIKGLSTSSLAVLKIIVGNSSITIKEIARNLHLSERMVGKHIQKLKAIGAIIRIGGDKGGRWKLKFQSSQETRRDSSG